MPSFPKLFAFSVAWLVIAGSALIADTGDYDGIYRPVGPEFETWDCRSVGADGGALEIRGGQFRGVENLCQLTNPTDVNGLGATLYEAQCRSDGGQWHQRVMLMNAENGVYFLTDGFVAEWQSCENLGVQTASSGGVKQEPLVSESVAAEIIETDESAPFDVTAYDGTYIIELGRVWRDVYWTGQDNEFYVPGRVEPLSRAHVRADGGQLELIEAIEFQASDGPVFEAFVGRITESGAFNFWADVNYLVGRPKPYALRASIELGSGLEDGEALDAEPQGFNAAYDARVRLLRVSTKGSTAGRAEPSEAERLAAQQDGRAAEQGVGPATMTEKDVVAQQRADEQAIQAELDLENRAVAKSVWKLDPDYDGKVAGYESGDASLGFSCFPNYNFLTFTFVTKARIANTDTPQITFIFDGEAYPWQRSNHGGQTWAGSLEDPYETGHGLHTLRLSFNATNHNAGWWTTLANKFMQSNRVALNIQGTEYPAMSLNGSARALRNIASLRACQ